MDEKIREFMGCIRQVLTIYVDEIDGALEGDEECIDDPYEIIEQVVDCLEMMERDAFEDVVENVVEIVKEENA